MVGQWLIENAATVKLEIYWSQFQTGMFWIGSKLVTNADLNDFKL